MLTFIFYKHFFLTIKKLGILNVKQGVNMTKNMFWPIYMKLEQEFKELSYYITIDKNQFKTYSINII
jgi:hypothetical protein